MVNAHNHSNENWFRGMWDNLPLEPWMLFSYPALAAPAQTPDEIYLRTVLGAIEQLRSGATCVVDFLYELDGFTDDTVDAVVRAYRDVGLRALIALGIGDRAYHETVVLEEGLVPRSPIHLLAGDRPPTGAPRGRGGAADVGDGGGVRAPDGRALPPARRGDLDLPRAERAAALHRRD